MNPVRKYDAGHAITASMVSRAHGGKAKPEDFMPYGKTVKGESLQDYMQAFGPGVKIGNRKRR